MNNWRNIKKIAMISGIISIVFTGLAAFTTYELDKILNYSTPPASLFEYSIFSAMLPFLLAAVLSFLVVAFSSKAAKAAAEKEPEEQEKEPQPEPEGVFTKPPT